MSIEITNVSKKFNKIPVLDEVSFTMESGKISCLLGASGSGKTTLLRIIMGAIPATKGKVAIDGITVPNRELLAQIGFMPQQEALYPELTIWQNMKFFAGIQNLKKDDFTSQALRLLKIVGLEQEKNKLIRNCSGGMIKRASLAATLLHHPRILILDEPTVGIDPVLRRQIWHYLKSLKNQGITIIITTHVMDEVHECDNAALLRGGKILMADSVSNLIAKSPDGKIEDLFFLENKEESLCFQ